jgi:hypothetical protein
VPKKKQQTIAKRNREQAVAEKRRLKRERKQAVKAARAAGLDPELVEYDPVRGEFIPPDPEAEEPAEGDAEANDTAANDSEPSDSEPSDSD